MMINSFEINESKQMKPCVAEKTAEVYQRKDARIWLDLQGAEPGELESWLDVLGVKGLSRRLCHEASDRPGFYPLKNEILLVIPVPADTGHLDESDYIVFLCRENLLLTMHQKPVLDPRRVTSLQESDEWLPDRSISGFLSAVMIDMSLKCLRQTIDLRSSIFAVEERMDRDPDAVQVEEIMDMRSDLLLLGAMVSDQLPSLQALSKTDKPFFNFKHSQEYMNCALANLQAADGSLTWLDGRIGALRSGFDMHAQDKTNNRLGMLTILSAIFMPITLLAGIWGMNFESMPELKYPFSYPAALGLMAVVGLGMYFFFRRTGWFD